jgi:predicted dehydrogenase
MTDPRIQVEPVVTAEELAAAIGATDFSNYSTTVIGYGNMGKEYVKALRALGVGGIRVCSRSPAALEELNGATGVESISGGFDLLEAHAEPRELGIVATPVESLVPASVKLASLGFRKLLIEKPISLWSREIRFLDEKLNGLQVEGICAFNRIAYPSFQEIKSRCRQEGGITSCTYTLTEMIRDDWTERFSSQELGRWGIANSMHVMSLAHGLIGLPVTWSAHRSGKLDWHPSGSVFVGSGISNGGTPFSYHADWGSTGRWSVEANTAASSYRLCPLEQVLRRTSPVSDWEEVPVTAFAPQIKAGFAEQVAAMLDDDIRRRLPLVSLSDTAALTWFAEDVFGYDSNSHSKLKKEPETTEAVS